MTEDEVAALAMKLPPASRADLARELLHSLHNHTDPEIAHWLGDVIDAEELARCTYTRAVLPPECAAACETLFGHIAHDDGLLRSLRPFTGVNPVLFSECLSALRTLRECAASGQSLPFAPISAALCLMRTVQSWALDDHGMLRRNKLIDAAQLEAIRSWHDEFYRSSSAASRRSRRATAVGWTHAPLSRSRIEGLPNKPLKPTNAGHRTMDRLEGRGVASFARHSSARPATMERLVRPLQLNEGTLGGRRGRVMVRP